MPFFGGAKVQGCKRNLIKRDFFFLLKNYVCRFAPLHPCRHFSIPQFSFSTKKTVGSPKKRPPTTTNGRRTMPLGGAKVQGCKRNLIKRNLFFLLKNYVCRFAPLHPCRHFSIPQFSFWTKKTVGSPKKGPPPPTGADLATTHVGASGAKRDYFTKGSYFPSRGSGRKMVRNGRVLYGNTIRVLGTILSEHSTPADTRTSPYDTRTSPYVARMGRISRKIRKIHRNAKFFARYQYFSPLRGPSTTAGCGVHEHCERGGRTRGAEMKRHGSGDAEGLMIKSVIFLAFRLI
jgi:hypothetical protein